MKKKPLNHNFIFIQQMFFVSKAQRQMFYARSGSGRYRRLSTGEEMN
ncbi:hypothetical protein [Lysinibacillus pakistanensis]|nr:hypothetical protein [Lysinibacillus pakistanensis]